MQRTVGRASDPSVAADQGQQAATEAGVRIVGIEDLGEIVAVSNLFDQVWGTGDESLLAPGMLRAMLHAGNYGAGAYTDGRLAGAIVGFLGRDDDGVYLHSHILGVSAERRGGTVGFALKQHQRAWALARGMRKVTWTFDPLVRRNAFFNVHKLRADADEYLVRFYGSMSDEINDGDETDRVLMVWRLDSPAVELAARARQPDAEPDTDAHVALSKDCVVDKNGWGKTIVCATPEDIVALRRDDPDRALAWRTALRETLGTALNDGYRVTGFSRTGWYVLERSE
jgi:predicted GNAT superfamily acetyltransferase